MGQRIVPVTLGSPRFQSLELEGLRVTAAEFAPHTFLAPHVHDRTVIAVMLEGSFDLTIRSRTEPCVPETVFVEPGGERHANRIGRAGARVVVMEPAPLYESQALRPCGGLLGAPAAFRYGDGAELARRLRREILEHEGNSALAIESLAVELIGGAAGAAGPRTLKPVPRWLERARELVHGDPLRPLRVQDAAAEVGVHPVHLTRVFRQHFGLSFGEYQRRRRLQWAAERLAGGGETVAHVALRAGFADQPHFTRAFKRFSGLTPARFRAGARRRAGSSRPAGARCRDSND